MNTSTPQEPLLTSSEVKRKIAACAGGTGIGPFRKWTRCIPPVLPRQYLPEYKQPRYRLSDVIAACMDLKPAPKSKP